jgi:hypothetical protein
MNPVLVVNLAVRFALELCALAALARWGWRAGAGGLTGLLAAVAAALAAALLWGAFVAPKARFTVPVPARFAVELVVLGSAAAGLAVSAPRPVATAFVVAVAAHEVVRAALTLRVSPSSRARRRS